MWLSWPILDLLSLGNTIHKLISKTIANRLKIILPHIISNSQSAFVPERKITDNILIAYESLHFLRRKKKGKQEFMSIKLDIIIAYDMVQ